MEDGRITFLWKDYAGGNKTRTMTLDAAEFIRRFLLHILPSGFVRIRQFGFLANRVRKEKLVLCRKLLFTSAIGITGCVAAKDLKRCPVCKVGNMIRIGLHYQADRLIVMHQHDSS
jgi:hypothetical protein